MKKERENLENAASKLLSLAMGSGAQEAEVCGTFGHSTRIQLEKQDYHMASSDDGYELGLRVLKDHQQGFASCNTTDPAELKEVAARAMEIAAFSPKNPHNAISPTENIPSDAPPERWDERLENLSLKTQRDWTQLMVEVASRDKRLKVNEGFVSISASHFLVANSHGTHKVEGETTASWSLMGMGAEGENITSFDYFSHLSHSAARTPKAIQTSCEGFLERVLSNLKTGPAASYKGLVAFSPRAVIDILLSPLCYHLNGRNVVEKTGRWNKDHLGKNILNSQITIEDLPWEEDRAGCGTFDREGVPTKRHLSVEKGDLRGFFIDNYAACALDLPSSGHAAGGPSAPPGAGPHCLSMAGGTDPLESLLARTSDQQGNFLVVQRFSGQTDPITGDFSGVAKGGEWWVGGKLAYCVKETLISGNLFEVLGSSLYGISQETEVVDSSESAPTLVADRVSVTTG